MIGGVVMVLVSLASAQSDDERSLSSCRKAGEEFSVGGIPQEGGWPKEAIDCCPSLVDREKKENFDDQCHGLLMGGYTGVCLFCGDGSCDSKLESKCNCPEDCSRDEGK